MAKKILEILKQKDRERIEQHLPAKDAPVLSEDERSSLDRFVEAFDDAWVSGRDKSRAVEDDGFHPSSLGIATGKCSRRNVYLLRGVEKQNTFPPRVMRIFGNGHAVHDRLQTHMEKMDVGMQSEIPIVYNDPPVRGHCDGVLEWEGKKIVIEIKSCSDDVFINRLKWKKPKDDHFAQANVYAHVLGLDTIWIIYENKNTQEIKIFEKAADRAASQKILDDWHAQYLCYKDDKLPKRPYKPASPTCAGCDLKEHCFGDSDVGVDIKVYKEKVKELNGLHDE